MRKNDYTGRRYGSLVAIKPTERSYHSRKIWLFECDCGRTTERAITRCMEKVACEWCSGRVVHSENGDATPSTKRVHFRLNAAEYEALNRAVELSGVSRNTLIRRFVMHFLENA